MNIAFSLTKPQMRARTKTVTRRVGWETLKPGQILNAIEKGQGLKRGERVKVIGQIRVESVQRERLDRIVSEPVYGAEECRLEGFPELTPAQFIMKFCQGHKGCRPDSIITRIAFNHL